MLLRNVLRFGIALELLCVVGPSTATACDYGVWGYYGLNYHRQPLRTGNLPTPPYFAIHPPVYYSGLQYRPYGDSPFAYFPRRPMIAAMPMSTTVTSGPKIIENPYFTSEPAETPSGTTTSQTIINPYYAPGDGQLVDVNP